MKDVATSCRWKFLPEGALKIPVGLLLFVALYVAPLMVADEIAQERAP